jgi:hypothetical protein
MKHTVHVTVTYAVEVDSDKIKKEFGRGDRRTILEYAKNNYNPKNAFDVSAKIFESYPIVKQRVSKGRGSY